ncbi:putative pentatricopeptide repeat-containing protein isoform X1 [Iris pallida]|uniref:Pentatricopeptide repeat-containing protein isoform X1 n=1 Tax=Iris pallida TaxID=29817 RepID=A0AAX6E3E5_IRIPA|nr:putative pentatricopeptide repeat-containing protein isoform X1 [Iris pallida]
MPFARLEGLKKLLLFLMILINIKANEVIYNALIHGQCKKGEIDAALSTLEKMVSAGCLPDSYTYNALIGGFFSEKKLTEAMSIVNDMVERGVEPTVVTYNILINGMVKKGDLGDAKRIFEQMVSSGCKPDACTYTIFIHAYCSEGNVEEAENVIEGMIKAGISLDVVAYNSFIDGCGNMGLLDKAFSALKRMADAAYEPNYQTYSIFLKHLFKRNHAEKIAVSAAEIWKVHVDTILELLDQMIAYGLTLCISNYQVLVAELCRRGRLEEARILVSRMKESGLSLNEAIYTSLINCCCSLQLYREASTYLYSMIGHGYLPHIRSYQLLLSGLCDHGNVEKAKLVFSYLLGRGYNFDEIVWTILIDGLLKKDHFHAFSEMLSIMEERQCSPSPETYALLRKEYPSLENGLQKEMKG